MKLNVIKNKKIFLSIAGSFIILSIVAIATLGIRPGIDFTSGSMWQIRVPNASETAVKDFF
jgi:preprotein translocase subunit SecF